MMITSSRHLGLVPRRLTLALRAVCLALPLLAATAASTQAQVGAGATAADLLDLEFWKSADRLATPAAYKAYLDRFPNGVFAPLAREAMQKSTLAQPNTTPAPTTVPATAPASAVSGPVIRNVATPAASLKHFSEPSQTGSIEHPIGSRFQGSGPLTVGLLGARKQIVLPGGEWVLLSAWDHNDIEAGALAPSILQFTRMMPMTGTLSLSTVSFGHFEGDRLASVMVTMFNRATFNGSYTSPAGESCEANQAPMLAYIKDGPLHRRMCVMTTLLADPLGENSGEIAPLGAMAHLRAAMQRLGAKAPGPGLATMFHYAGRSDGWLRVMRVDFPQVHAPLATMGARDWAALGIPDAKDRSAPALYVGQLRNWVLTYAATANEGWRRNLELPDLAPDQAPRKPELLPDFSPRF